MKFHIVSDIHLEFNHQKNFEFTEGADVLLVAGDTIPVKYLQEHRTDHDALYIQGKFRELLQKMADNYDKVYFVMGNHEHYGFNIQESEKVLRNFLRKSPLATCDHFDVLESGWVWLDNNRILLVGATLWTDMYKDDPIAHQYIGRGMNDFRLIMNGKRWFSTYDAMEIHQKTMELFDEFVKVNDETNIIMMTHHCPSFKCSKEFNTISPGYCSSLEDFILDNPNIKAWVCGHTHHKFDFMVGDCRVVSNPLGYPIDYEVHKAWKPHNVVIEL